MIWGALVFAVVTRADPGFVQTVSAADFAQAGLQKLTPAELARLETLVEQYKTGVVAVVQSQAAASASESRQDLEQKVVAAETKVREAELKAKEAEAKAMEAETKTKAAEAKARETQAKIAAAPAKKQPGWLAALTTLARASEKPEDEEPLESRLVGDFNGWNGRTVFTLENGTKWVQQNKVDTYSYSPALHAPMVRITPASMGGFWFDVKGVNSRLRVVPLVLPDK